MAKHGPNEVDLGGYLLGRLEPGERARVEQDLAASPELRAQAAELGAVADLMEGAAPAYAVPAGLEARTFRALERAIGEDETDGEAPVPAPRRRGIRLPRLNLSLQRAVTAMAAVAALGAAVLAGSLLGGEEGPPGTLELQASLRAPDGNRQANAAVRETGIGRVVSFDSRDLPILPKGEYYALWFVGPGDSRASPNRISAGTFHPDPDGRSEVTFAAAVDPKRYPVLAVTEERGDGDPAPSLPDVLRSAP